MSRAKNKYGVWSGSREKNLHTPYCSGTLKERCRLKWPEKYRRTMNRNFIDVLEQKSENIP